MLYNDLILAALRDAARKALQMIPEGYRYQSPLIRESIEKGLVQGREEGRQKGRQEGREQGLRSTLQRLLTKRYGALPAWAEERVAHATVEQLEIYLETMLTAPGLEEALQLNG